MAARGRYSSRQVNLVGVTAVSASMQMVNSQRLPPSIRLAPDAVAVSRAFL